jgi:MYND finger
MHTIKINLGPRILEAAEAEQPRDDALRAYALFNLAKVKAMGLEPWKYDQVEEMLEQGEEAIKGCKAWFPSLFRKLYKSQLAESAEGYLEAVRRKYPRDFRTQTLGRAVSRAATEEVTTASLAKTNAVAQLHTCAFCGSEGRDLSLCAGCKKVRYCSKACQKASWKGGHKNDCSVSTEADEAEQTE